MITHIFFDLHGTLADGARVHECYCAGVGRVLSGRYGGAPDAWARANRAIVADWDSYFTDLDLAGDEGYADMWEGYFRTTRAMFRLTDTPEPSKAELLKLTRELPGLAVEGCDALYPEVRGVLKQLGAAGYKLGAASNALLSQVRATLAGGGILGQFDAPIMAADVAEQWVKDADYYRIAAIKAQVPPSSCLVVDDNVEPLAGAREAGMRTAWVKRRQSEAQARVDVMLRDDLSALPQVIQALR
ncbi:MAG: HAD family hydrolase [Anaerolineae bacterium]